MPVRLIFHADDFGLTPGINRAVAELFDAGVLSSASLMVTAPFVAEAAELARSRPGLGVGCHLTFVDGVPSSPPDTIRTLLTKRSGSFRSSLADFALALLRGAVDPAELAREAEAQIGRAQQLGIQVTHLDTHKHLHAFPAVASAVLQAADRCGIHAVRMPFEPAWSRRLGHAPWLRRLQLAALSRLQRRFWGLPALRSGRVMTTSGTLGIAATGTLDSSVLRRTLLETKQHGENHVWEFCCHPGYVDDELRRAETRLQLARETELRALLTTVPEVLGTMQGISVIHYGDLGGTGSQRTLRAYKPATRSEEAR